MDNVLEELKQIFQNFRWIDDIPEDQNRRDEICLEAKAALLIEANCTRIICKHCGYSILNAPPPLLYHFQISTGHKFFVSQYSL